jgi:transcriptional regulator with XRE-family HTH domain
MKMKLLALLQEKHITVITAATALGVATSQIHRWDRQGINPNNPHYAALIKLLGKKLETVEPSNKAKIRRFPKQLNLVETDLQLKPTKARPTGLPHVVIRPKANPIKP